MHMVFCYYMIKKEKLGNRVSFETISAITDGVLP